MFNKIKNLFSGKKEHSQKIIYVSFIDVNNGKVFATSNMPVSLLPNSFEAHTTMSIQEQNWEVVEARPITSEEFIISGKLDLFLRKLNFEKMPLGDILYSLPSISNEIPSIKDGSSKLGKKIIELHEDDWRQIEFISKDFEEEVDMEISQIEQIFNRSSKKTDNYVAFTEIHVREGLKQPINKDKIYFNDLISCFANKEVFDGIAYQNIAGTIEDGFALKLDLGLYLYGIESQGIVKVLCLKLINKSDISIETLSSIEKINQKYDLLLVDWCDLVKVPAKENSVKNYLMR